MREGFTCKNTSDWCWRLNFSFHSNFTGGFGGNSPKLSVSFVISFFGMAFFRLKEMQLCVFKKFLRHS